MAEPVFKPIPPGQGQKQKPKKKHTIRNIIIGVIVVIFAIAAFTPSDDDENEDDRASASASTEKSGESSSSEDTSNEETSDPKIASDFDANGYFSIDDDVLYEYGAYMTGEKVVTVINVEDVSTDHLSANTSANDSFFFSINCYFENKSDIDGIKEGDKVTVAGTVDETGIGSTVPLRDCTLIGLGEVAGVLEAGKESQRATCEQMKQQHEQAAAEAAANEKAEYAGGCESVDYSDVSRNPDNYDGKKIKVSGTIIQVDEGWFDSVTLRLDAGGGNTWYITYSREEGESRILEGDYITAYGESTGVTSYTTVLGSQVTIPSMKMKYYD